MVIIMFFEDHEKCPLLEDQESTWDKVPYCAVLYNELTTWTLSELCYKNFKDCPKYKKVIEKVKNKALQ